ncbi:MAG: 5'-nucleotidase C-terminal domain-containing protein [Sandaracinaceae bacterium]|nr:5'-nucleotidase C-terminal domain-containing protein [Sandaracinaceae bacterium]
MGRRLGLLAFATLGLWLAAGSASAQRVASVQTIARVIASGDVDGRFARPVCDRVDTLVPSEYAAFTYALQRNAQDRDHPMVIDTGGLLAPHGVARFSAERNPEALARMVRDLGYRALALGLNDLAAPRDSTIAAIAALRSHGIPTLASNLRCGAEAAAFCRELVDASDGLSMHRVNGHLMAVMAVLRPNATGLISPVRARGIVLEDPVATIARFTRMARERGAEIVLAVVDDHVEGGALNLATELPEDARPDLMLVSGQDELLFARPQSVRPVLVGPPENDGVEILIRDSLEMRDGYEFLAQPLEGRGISVAEPVRRWISRIGPDYCAQWGRPLAGATLSEPIEVDQMLSMVARILREATGADIAILNRQALDTRWRQAREGSLTASDVYIALEYDDPLLVAEVDERWLKRLARNAADRGTMVTPGLTWSGTGTSLAVQIGGHPAEARARYRVVTIRFLAAGGDGEAVPSLGTLGEWQTFGEESMRTTTLAYLEQPREGDPRQALPDADGTLEWQFRADADLLFSGSSIDNPRRRCTEAMLAMPGMCDADGFALTDGARVAAYDATQLSLADVITFGFNVTLAANAAAPDWTWQNTGNFLYRTAWTEPTGTTGSEFVEAADQIRTRSTLSWRGLREGDDQWYLPDPTADLFIESEFTAPESRGYQWFLTRPTLGFRFQLADKLQFQINGGFQVQVFQPDTNVEGGFGATMTLAPWDMIKLDQQFARLAFTFDYFLAFSEAQARGTLRGTVDAAFDLAGPLALVMQANLYLQHQSAQDIGAAISVSAGIRLGYLGRAVGP